MDNLVFRYTGFQFFFSLLFWLPIFYEYQKRLGLTDTQIAQIQSFYYLTFCWIEIPTGFLADRWGRLPCLRWGAVLGLLSNLLPVVVDLDGIFKSFSAGTFSSPHAVYYQFLGHFFLLALARSLISGASSAYLYDHLHARGEAGTFKKIEGRARSYSLFGKVLVWPLVGVLMSWHLSLPYWFTALASALAVGFAWALPRDRHDPMEEASAEVRSHGVQELRAILKILRTTPLLLLIMVQGIAIFVLARICQVNLFQPLLILKSFEVSSLGGVMALMTVFEAIGSRSGSKSGAGSRNPGLKAEVSLASMSKSGIPPELYAVFLWTGVSALCLLALTVNGKWGTLVSLSVFSYAVGVCFPIQRQLFNDFIPQARYRATLLSIESILDRAVCAGVASVLGASISGGKIENFLGYSAGLTGAGILILLTLLFITSRFTVSRDFTKAQ